LFESTFCSLVLISHFPINVVERRKQNKMWRSFILVIFTLLTIGNGFTLLNHNNVVSRLQLQIDDNNNDSVFVGEETCRRGFIGTAFGIGVSTTGAILSFSSPAFADSKQEETDKVNVVKGYKRLQYLLDNWEKETTVCGMGGDKLERSCDRTPMKVMEYMGYKSTTDPLYKADKTLRRLYENAPAKRDSEFVEAVEVFAENADEASGMAFISSWGESNPGGGKDRVELFIERAKKNVEASRNSLKIIIDILELDTSKK